MTQPEGNLDVRVDIAPDAEPDGDPGDWLWEDVSAYRRQKDDIGLNLGRDDESGTVEPADSSFTADMRDGHLSPRNPYSTLYQRIGQNTPIRYRLAVFADDFDRTVAGGWGTSTSGQAWSTGVTAWSTSSNSGKVALAAANTATEGYITAAGGLDVDFVYSASMSAVTLTQPWISGATVRRVDADNYYRVHTEFKPSGEIYLKINRHMDGGEQAIGNDLSLGAGLYTPGSKIWTRIQAEGGTIRARAWAGTLGAEPVGVWHVTTDEADEVEGTGFGFFQWRFAGNTNVGTLTVTIDDVRVQALLWQGSVPEWPPRWDKSGNDGFMPLGAAGPMRRLGQGDDSLESPLRRQLPRYNPAGYWSFEDGSDARSAGSAVSPGRAALVVGEVTFGNDDKPAGASSTAQFGTAAGSFIRGVVLGNSTSNFSAMVFFKLAALPGAETTIIEWQTSSGTARRWKISSDAGAYLVRVYDSEDVLIATDVTGHGVDKPDQWTALQLETSVVGGTINFELIWHRVGSTVFWSGGGSVVASTGRLTQFYIPNSTGLNNALFGHVWAGTSALPFVNQTFLAVSNGYIGELAADRVERLCAEEGVALTLAPGTSEALGPQTPAKFLDLLQECAEADIGILYERANGLGYVPRGARYNPRVVMVLDWSGGDLAEAPDPTDDDQRLRNRWTVTRKGGASAVYEDAASIARHGRIKDVAEISLETDGQAYPQAVWRTAMTTVDELRWPTITLDLIANPQLRVGVLGLRPGSRIQVINPKSQIAGAVIDLIVEGISHTIGRFKWLVTLACSPATVWRVATWDEGSRWSAKTTTLQSSAAAGVTSLVINSTSKADAWSSEAGGYQWLLSGETVTVREVSQPRSVAVDLGQFVVNGIANWTATAGTLSLSTTQRRHPTANSALITVSGSPVSVGIRINSANRATVVAARVYTLTFWIYSSIATAAVNGVINWYNGASFLSSSGGATISVKAGQWTKYTTTATAPATATRAEYGGTQGGSPANGTLVYFYGVDLIDVAAAGYQQKAIVVRAVNGVSKTLPAAAPVVLAEPARWGL